jgi:hypothetical protein
MKERKLCVVREQVVDGWIKLLCFFFFQIQRDRVGVFGKRKKSGD